MAWNSLGRRRRGGSLGWALLLSLMINNLALLSSAIWMMRPRQTIRQRVIVDLVEPEPDSSPARRRRSSKAAQRPQRKRKVELHRAAKKPTARPRRRQKMVELTTPQTLPPDRARYLSDKNRRVVRETRARVATLKRQPTPSRPEQTKPTAPPPRRQARPSPLLSMRQPAAKVPKTPASRNGQRPPPNQARRAQTQRRNKLTALALNHRDFDRIYGKVAERQRSAARRSERRSKPGKASRWKRIQADLQNFVPEVRPGNQTALNTRADPFAVYIARMHRSIHKRWGFGFLTDLDLKPDGHIMNKMSLWTMVEIVVRPDGEVGKTTIVRPSGILAFDVAAMDAVYSSAPFEGTPRAIRSADGNVYLHWRFHRNHKQCGTFGVDPYILTKPPDGPIDRKPQELSRRPSAPRLLRAPGFAKTGNKQDERQAGAGKAPTGPDRAAHRFMQALLGGDPAAMSASCMIPFRSQGRAVAESQAQLVRMFGDMLQELGPVQAAPLRVLTPLAVRTELGHLPRGVEHRPSQLVALTRLGSRQALLTLEAENGAWRVSGLNL